MENLKDTMAWTAQSSHPKTWQSDKMATFLFYYPALSSVYVPVL